MKKKIFVFWFSLFLFLSCFAQRMTVLNTSEQVKTYNGIAQEYLYLATNSKLYFAGEYIYYTINNLKTSDNKVSDLSKIGYVALVDKNNNSIFKKKVFLKNGKAQGDYFIPTTISSGAYKLVGFTQWMLNAEKENLVITDINILNPYTNNVTNFLTEANEVNSNLKENEGLNSIPPSEIKMEVDKNLYSKRSLVNLSFYNKGFDSTKGMYSLSVRKKEVFDTLIKNYASTNFRGTAAIGNKIKKVGDSIYLPELKGALFYGKIKPKFETDSVPVENQKVSVSILGKENEIIIVETNSKGKFIFNINESQFSDNFIFQLLENDTKYDIVINDFPEIPKIDFEKTVFEISENYKKEMLKKSVHNQIENSYYNVKPDTILVNQNFKDPFHGNRMAKFNLDDYTRFTSFEETLTEIIFGVKVKTKNGKKIIDIKKLNAIEGENKYEPLVLVDGFHVTNHENIISYNTNNIKSISFLRETYYLGSSIYDGVISIETFDNVYLKNSVLFKSTFDNSDVFQKKKNYFKQKYTDDSLSHIPDFRSQLLWEPFVDIQKEVSFYTSDNIGEYVVVLEGVTNEGKFVHSEKTFEVK